MRNPKLDKAVEEFERIFRVDPERREPWIASYNLKVDNSNGKRYREYVEDFSKKMGIKLRGEAPLSCSAFLVVADNNYDKIIGLAVEFIDTDLRKEYEGGRYV